MDLADDSGGSMIVIDQAYEFSAPCFFDFLKEESEEDKRKAEFWFDTSLSYGPSPFMARIKAARSMKVKSLYNFNEAMDTMEKVAETTSDSKCPSEIESTVGIIPAYTNDALISAKETHGNNNNDDLVNKISPDNTKTEEDKDLTVTAQEKARALDRRASETVKTELTVRKEKNNLMGSDACTPKLPNSVKNGVTDSKKQQTARKIVGMLKNPSALNQKSQLHSSRAKVTNSVSAKRDACLKKTSGTPSLAQQNQAIKRQKLDEGKSRQIINAKVLNLPHKTKLGLVSSSSILFPSTANKTSKENRKKVYSREQAAPFVSMAEMMNKFQSSTRDLSLPHIKNSSSHNKPTLTLTRPKEPEFETAQRSRPIKLKSTAELEEEMLANMPKFKARPINKKILQAPTLPTLERSTPQPPEFQEFHLETMARANQNAETSSIVSTEVSQHTKQRRPHLTEPKTPALHALLRARPPPKSSMELEQEELEKFPKFKARPLNEKIFESKGELGMFCNVKKHVTIPREFHFATDDRMPPPASVAELFDKLSLNSESRHENPLPRNTTPNPFHLRTEERGAEKVKKLVTEVIHKQLEEERSRVPKATPYPYTTDFPVIPPKPEPRQCTKPEPFELESLIRHEEEVQREMAERARIEREKAKRRIFKAQPILKEDPIPLPEKMRIALTEVQGFNLHVEHRAVERAEFDHKIKEKETMYKRHREETEAARMLEDEKELKHLRRTMVPHARPVPKFDHPFCPRRSLKETTKPRSPQLYTLQRKERRRSVYPVAATSSAASQMR